MMSEIPVKAYPYHDKTSPDTSTRSSSVGDSDEELTHDLRGALTLDDDDDETGGTSPTRGGRRRSRRAHNNNHPRAKKSEEGKEILREKFQIESLYIQLSELKIQNQALREIWERVRRSTNEDEQ